MEDTEEQLTEAETDEQIASEAEVTTENLPTSPEVQSDAESEAETEAEDRMELELEDEAEGRGGEKQRGINNVHRGGIYFTRSAQIN